MANFRAKEINKKENIILKTLNLYSITYNSDRTEGRGAKLDTGIYTENKELALSKLNANDKRVLGLYYS